MGMGKGRKVADAIRDAGVVVESETMEIALNRVDRMIDHDLFEPVIGSLVIVYASTFIGIGNTLAASERNEIDEFSLQRSDPGIQSEQRDVHTLPAQRCGVSIRGVHQRQIPGGLHGVGDEGVSGARIESDPILLQ